jgi:hypothetical protein
VGISFCSIAVAASVVAGLGVGAECTGVIVADHHDQSRPDNRQQHPQFGRQFFTWCIIANTDCAEPALDIAQVTRIEDSGYAGAGWGFTSVAREQISLVRVAGRLVG